MDAPLLIINNVWFSFLNFANHVTKLLIEILFVKQMMTFQWLQWLNSKEFTLFDWVAFQTVFFRMDGFQSGVPWSADEHDLSTERDTVDIKVAKLTWSRFSLLWNMMRVIIMLCKKNFWATMLLKLMLNMKTLE